MTYNFGESRVSVDPVRQKYLTAFFDPFSIAISAFRAIRGAIFTIFGFTWMSLIFAPQKMSEIFSTMTVKKFADVILTKPWLETLLFRKVSSLFFVSVGYLVVYIVFKWVNLVPIIAGRRRKKRSLVPHQIEEAFEEAYDLIVTKLERTYQRYVKQGRR